MKRNILLLITVAWLSSGWFAQSVEIVHQCMNGDKKLDISNDTISMGDSLIVVEVLKYYVKYDSSYHLIDFRNASSCVNTMENRSYEDVSFLLGIDSIMSVSGALIGDLDPMNGMYWAWQSGYINVKIEGEYLIDKKSKPFQYHLGGYLPPFLNSTMVNLVNENDKNQITIGVDLLAFFKEIETDKSITRPCKESVQLTHFFSKSFFIVD